MLDLYGEKMREVKNIQEEEFKILCAFKKYCNRFGLKYYLEGGTLLGAVRHKGFIPWDDDIDTIMPRQDYEKLIQLTKKSPINENIEVITRDSGTEFHSPYLKLCNKKTLVKEGENLSSTGIFIDVFPIDGAANSEKAIKSQYKRNNYLMLFRDYSWMSKNELNKLPLSKRIVARVCSFIGKDYWTNRVDKVFGRYEFGTTKYVSQIAWSSILVYNLTDEYKNQVELEFEGELFTVPSCYDKRLRSMYGDYMKLPPLEERNPKHRIRAYWKDEVI